MKQYSFLSMFCAWTVGSGIAYLNIPSRKKNTFLNMAKYHVREVVKPELMPDSIFQTLK